MGIENPFKAPGQAELDKWKAPGVADSKPKPPPLKPPEAKQGGGGGGKASQAARAAREREKALDAEPPPDALDMSGSPEAEKEKAAQAKLSNPSWVEPETCFQAETEVSVQLQLPSDKQHMTRVEVELFAKTAKGVESISKGEGHAKSDGKASVILPVYPPKDHDGGPVEYFFKAAHKLADMLSAENIVRLVSEKALKSADHILVPGIAFPKNSSFIHPKSTSDLKQIESKLKEWDAREGKKAKIVVYGHADVGEKEPKALSERRAMSAYAFIANDADTWESLYGKEKWGLEPLQILLKDLKFYKDEVDGDDGPNTQAAFRAFQKSVPLPETGKEDGATRKALFLAYMKGKHDIKIDADRFRTVSGHAWMGCATNNKSKESDKPSPANRRVVFVLLKESRLFPIHFPCQDGNENACASQCKKPGNRKAAGVKCHFYDELIREKQQAEAEADPDEDPVITEAELKAITGASDELVSKFQRPLDRALKKKGMRADLIKAHFLAQVCVESGSLKFTEELASGEAYEGREKLGNTQPGDGKRFKGRGLIQITGRDNYTRFGSSCGEDFLSGTNPKRVAEPKFAVLSAIWYWDSRNLSKQTEADDFLDICYGVNGGFTHVKERAGYLKKGYAAFQIPDAESRLRKVITAVSENLEKVLPLVEALMSEDPGLDSAGAAKKLKVDKKISHFQWMLYQEMPSASAIAAFKAKLGL